MRCMFLKRIPTLEANYTLWCKTAIDSILALHSLQCPILLKNYFHLYDLDPKPTISPIKKNLRYVITSGKMVVSLR